MGEIIAGIDIGTSKVATVIGLLNQNNEIEVLGKGIEPCNGVKKGAIVDVEGVYAAICTSIKQAEMMSNSKLKTAYINIPVSQIEVVNNRVSIEISDKLLGVRRQDITKILETSRNLNIPMDRQIVDVNPKQYFVDDFEGIKEPMGMKGSILGVDVEIIMGRTTTVDNLVRTVEMSDIKLDGIIVDSLASSEIILTADEKEFGVMLIDVGGTTTDISIFKEKEVIYNNLIHLGGDNITKDLSLGLKISLNEAERLKREFAFSIESLFDDLQTISVLDVSGEKKLVKVSDIAEIIEARANEIVKLSFEVFRNSGVRRSQITSVVMTGAGISYIDGCVEFAKNVFQIPFRIPSYKGLEGVKPEFITAYGILRYATNHARFTPSSDIKMPDDTEVSRKGGIFGKIKALLGNH